MSLKPEQPGPENYTPDSDVDIEFTYKWKTFRLNPASLSSDFPFRLHFDDDGYRVYFIEFRSAHDPPSRNDLGHPGDIWLNISPESYTLFALNSRKEWIRWPGLTLDKARLVLHPYLPLYALWCTIERATWHHCDMLADDLTGSKLDARLQLGGYASAESMQDDPSAGVRLLLLHEHSEPGITWLFKLLAEMPQTTDAVISTLVAGVQFLLAERKQMVQYMASAEQRAETAERKLAETERKLADLINKTAQQGEMARDLASTEARAQVAERKLVEKEQMWAERYQQKIEQQHDDSQTPSQSPRIGLKHLDLLFIGTPSGISWCCRICFALVANPELSSFLTGALAHAEQAHPSECAVLARASEAQIEEARRQLLAV